MKRSTCLAAAALCAPAAARGGPPIVALMIAVYVPAFSLWSPQSFGYILR